MGILFCAAVDTFAQVGRVTGRVLDATTLRPIVHARIQRLPGSYMEATDSTGSFSIEDCVIDSQLLFKHPFYSAKTLRAYDSIPMRVLLDPCCNDKAEAQQMFIEYCRKNLRYPASLRRKEIGGEVLIRFSLDSALAIRNVTMVKDIGGLYGKTANDFLLALPIQVRRMLSYFNSREFLLPLIFSYNKAGPQYTPPFSPDATVLEPVVLVAFGTRSIE